MKKTTTLSDRILQMNFMKKGNNLSNKTKSENKDNTEIKSINNSNIDWNIGDILINKTIKSQDEYICKPKALLAKIIKNSKKAIKSKKINTEEENFQAKSVNKNFLKQHIQQRKGKR
jgi:hypothetical protein